jgi:hypothetical protein
MKAVVYDGPGKIDWRDQQIGWARRQTLGPGCRPHYRGQAPGRHPPQGPGPPRERLQRGYGVRAFGLPRP